MKKVDLKENQVYCLKTTITVPIDGPPAFRSFTIGLKLPGEPTGKELNTFDKQLRAHKDYETALDNPTEMMKLTAEVHPKMKPLTPYEVEIIGHYTQLHIDIANTMQLRKDVLAQIPGLQDKFKQVHEVIPKIIKEFDNLLRDARIVQHPENKNETLVGYRQDLVEKYNETIEPFNQKIMDADKSIREWDKMLKEFESKSKKISKHVTYLQKFYMELYEHQDRFTLSTGVLTEDFNPFLEELRQLYDYWNKQHIILTDFIKEYKACEKESQDMDEYITKTGPRGLKKTWGN